MTPDGHDLWFIPLGGCGEIGMNMNLYGHDEQWLMIDCGVTFRDADGSRGSGYDIQMADPDFIAARANALQGLLLTHAHEDHIGAVAHLWRRLNCPVYATEFTAEMLKRKLAEHGLLERVPIKLVTPGNRFAVGVFDIEWVAHTHSVPDPCGIVIRTAAGNIFHTGDWKLDPSPLVGHGFDESHYRRIGDSGVHAMVCDSTCANQSGRSVSEGALFPGLLHEIEKAEGRVVVTCFGSNIARLNTLARCADATSRHLGLLGRSLIKTASVARQVGLWKHTETLVESNHLGFLPASSVLLVATGSQAEPRAALYRLSTDSFRDLTLDTGDTVIFSARAIPGNEKSIEQMIERFKARGVKVVTAADTSLPIHASGHPGADELSDLYDWIKPDVLIPVHGEEEHLDAHVKLAQRRGIRHQLNGRNGDLYMLSPTTAIRRGAVPVGRLGVGKSALERIG